jgi:hypothetical protein
MTETANQIEGLQPTTFYENELKTLLSQNFPHYSNTKLEDLHRNSLTNAEQEVTSVEIPNLISVLIDSSSETLSQLSKRIMEKLPEFHSSFLFTSEEIASIIHKISVRKNYGRRSKNIYEDKEPVFLFCWELFEYKQPGFILRERTLVGNLVKSLDKLILEMAKESPKGLQDLFSAYNKANYAFNKFKTEQTENKRKKQETSEEKERRAQEKILKKVEKIKKLEEISRIKEENNKKKEEDKKRIEDEKRKIEEERKKNDEEKKKAKEEKKREEDLKKKEQDPKKKSENQSSSLTIDMLFQRTSSKPAEKSLSSETKGEVSSSPCISRQNIFIYFSDSHLKPYFTGKAESNLQKESRSIFSKFESIDYNKDSEEEYEENNGEDLHSRDSDEEEESFSSSELENFKKFIVDDGHLSEEEKLENEEVAINSLWMNTELKEMKILENNDFLLENCRVQSITSEKIPIKVPEKICKIVKEVKPQKILVTENNQKEILEIAEGKFNKDEIIAAVVLKYPNISKAGVKNLIKEKMFKRKDGPRVYSVKRETEKVRIDD